jgi:hypothetical protein
MDIAARPGVAFETDGQDPLSHWSVVLKGTARRMDSDAEILESGVQNLVSASPTSKHDFIRITPDTVTGRRFRKGAAPSTPRPAPATSTGAHQPVRPPEGEQGWPGSERPSTKPIEIPHFPPRPTR